MVTEFIRRVHGASKAQDTCVTFCRLPFKITCLLNLLLRNFFRLQELLKTVIDEEEITLHVSLLVNAYFKVAEDSNRFNWLWNINNKSKTKLSCLNWLDYSEPLKARKIYFDL